MLNTPRLKLRGFGEADLNALTAMQADPVVMRHSGTGQPPPLHQSPAQYGWLRGAVGPARP